ncbi:MAG TPA: hypothetical protein VL651_05245 [Bacteroidia bacterium]|jgi:hypothetical protein|nr:hypothetical protein [Bacteroidia bacterium]
MANINDKRNFLRQELLKHADQISALRSKAAINDAEALRQMTEHASELQKNSFALLHLLDVEAEKVIVEVPAKIPVVPTPPDVTKNVAPPPPVAEIKQTPAPETVVAPQQPVAPVPQNKPLPDLKTFIGLNEKLMLIKTLFNGDSNLYEIEIAKLNGCHSRAESDKLFSAMAAERNWKADSEAVVMMQSILKRRTA